MDGDKIEVGGLLRGSGLLISSYKWESILIKSHQHSKDDSSCRLMISDAE